VSQTVVLQLRLPRIVLGAMAGAMLALSGTLLQWTRCVTRLRGLRELLGVSNGASLVMASIIIFHLLTLPLYPVAALVGGRAFAGSIVLLSP